MGRVIDRINKAASYIEQQISGRKPVVGIVLGSGLGDLANQIENPLILSYSSIPEFPASTAIGHKGNLICGELGGKTVLAMQGRFHYYEGYDMPTVTIGIRVMHQLGIKNLFVSNAAGGCNQAFSVGDLMIIKDHISLFPNPLIGPNIDELGPRFPDMTTSYDLDFIARAEKIAGEEGIELRKGVYLGSTGPTYETPAEVRFYRTIGADALGMSTVPEVIVARHCGMKVFGISVITNISNLDNEAKILNDGQDVIIQADKAAKKMCLIFRRMIESL